MKFTYPVGATPLDPNEIEGLIPEHIRIQDELNEWEQANISQAEWWVFSTKHPDILTRPFLQKLHKKMFDKTWRWAGNFRRTEKNIGVDWIMIPAQLEQLFNDVKYQIVQNSYNFDEIAARFHHRLVSIHPFANGNGRHARLMTDILLINNHQARFTWGMNNISHKNEVRKKYIDALRMADQNDYRALFEFVRS